MVHLAACHDREVEVLKAIADPVRYDLLKRVAAGSPDVACTALVEQAGVAKSTVSYHMKTLRQAGLVEVRKAGRNFFYTFKPEALQSLSSALVGLGQGDDTP
jgi:ArsR family transcriptional regulator